MEGKSTKRVSSIEMLKIRFIFQAEQNQKPGNFWVATNSVPDLSRSTLCYHIFKIEKLIGQDVINS